MNTEALTLIETIELTLTKSSFLGFDPDILAILDDIDIGKQEIENLKTKMDPDVFIYLFNIANSAYHGSLKMGPVKHFFDVVNRLGTQYVKVQILLFSLRRLAREDIYAENTFARSFAASVVGRVMARGFGFRDEGAQMVELGCLISSIGALMMIVYRNHYHSEEYILSNDFIEQNQIYLTERMIRRFQLPEYLHEMIMNKYLALERMAISLPGVVKLANAFVDWSFHTYDNKLVLRTAEISLDDKLSPSLAAIIADKFTSAGLNKYLVVLQDTTQKTEKNQ